MRYILTSKRFFQWDQLDKHGAVNNDGKSGQADVGDVSEGVARDFFGIFWFWFAVFNRQVCGSLAADPIDDTFHPERNWVLTCQEHFHDDSFHDEESCDVARVKEEDQHLGGSAAVFGKPFGEK